MYRSCRWENNILRFRLNLAISSNWRYLQKFWQTKRIQQYSHSNSGKSARLYKVNSDEKDAIKEKYAHFLANKWNILYIRLYLSSRRENNILRFHLNLAISSNWRYLQKCWQTKRIQPYSHSSIPYFTVRNVCIVYHCLTLLISTLRKLLIKCFVQSKIFSTFWKICTALQSKFRWKGRN
jgi:hypothetical protein